jgi:hypothetical protein
MNTHWINQQILISPNELFESGSEGSVVAHEGQVITIKLSAPVQLPDGKSCSHVVASVRHMNRTILEVLNGNPVLCALTLVPNDKFNMGKPCDVSWWRGGGAVIGDLRSLTPYSEPQASRG